MPYFPVFMNLERKEVLVVGGGKVAARKVRALLRSGARVSVIAEQLGEELEQRHRAGVIAWTHREFSPRRLVGAWLVFAATDDAGLNRAVFDAGEKAGIPVNVVDDGAHCRFISPAVIDRDPIQVAVSTGGGSPMMARAVRSWIERILPHGLGKVAAAASDIRQKIGRGLSVTDKRRNWDFLIDRSRIVRWSSQPVESIARHMQAEYRRRANRTGSGKVFLVGAGPGRTDLLTLRAVEVLQQADLILHDKLVPEAILDQARRDAERVDVGKRAGKHHGVQDRIHRLMVEGARAGKTVVRLKGGDAFVFGRGGEELQYLDAHGIEYEVVPGITAALGCAAFAGIPLTHRELAHEVTLSTGHLADEPEFLSEPNGDPTRSARSSGVSDKRTRVIYMGIKQARAVGEKLLAQGVAPSTPAALIINGTMDSQRVLYGTVSALPALAAEVADGAPGLFIIGKVAALGQALAWFGVEPAFEEAA